jgi:polyisoprenoid-binding protein YceI
MNKELLKYTIISLLLLLSVSMTAQESIKVNTRESLINWMGKKPVREHKGTVRLSGGELTVNKNEVTGGSFTIDMPTITDIDLKDPNDKNKLESHLKSADFFDVGKFPTAKFVITRITKNTGTAGNKDLKTTHRVEGDLTMKGVTKKISFDASINFLNGKFTASTPEFTINRTEWGVNYQSKSVMSGIVDQFIYDDITLSIELVSK